MLITKALCNQQDESMIYQRHLAYHWACIGLNGLESSSMSRLPWPTVLTGVKHCRTGLLCSVCLCDTALNRRRQLDIRHHERQRGRHGVHTAARAEGQQQTEPGRPREGIERQGAELSIARCASAATSSMRRFCPACTFTVDGNELCVKMCHGLVKSTASVNFGRQASSRAKQGQRANSGRAQSTPPQLRSQTLGVQTQGSQQPQMEVRSMPPAVQAQPERNKETVSSWRR